MKKLLFVCLVYFSPGISFAQTPLENHAESVCPFGNDFYLSNTTGGQIHKIGSDGKMEVFSTAAGKVLGLASRDKWLYAASNSEDGGHLLVFAPPSNEIVLDLPIPEAKQLNDIAVDKHGMLYVTDRIGDKIYAVDMTLGTVNTLLENGIQTPNGICVDESLNRLLVCNTIAESSIYSVDLKNGKVTELLATGKPHLDGLAMDHSGNIYLTSWSADWKSSQLIRYSPIFEQSILQKNENGMADLFLFPSENRIALANWYPFSATLVTWEDGQVKEIRIDKP